MELHALDWLGLEFMTGHIHLLIIIKHCDNQLGLDDTLSSFFLLICSQDCCAP